MKHELYLTSYKQKIGYYMNEMKAEYIFLNVLQEQTIILYDMRVGRKI